LGLCYTPNKKYCLVFEFVSCGTLRDWITNKDAKPMSGLQILKALLALANGISELHRGMKKISLNLIFNREINSLGYKFKKYFVLSRLSRKSEVRSLRLYEIYKKKI
jgi:serine/threonine protein kinase